MILQFFNLMFYSIQLWNWSYCDDNLYVCVSLSSHLPRWPWPGGVFLQLPALHFQVQVPRIPLQVTIATVQYHCIDARTNFIWLTQQLFKGNIQAYNES